MINGMVFDIGPFLRDEADKTVGKCWGRFYLQSGNVNLIEMEGCKSRSFDLGISWNLHSQSLFAIDCRSQDAPLILPVFKIEPRQNIQAGKQSYCDNWNCRDLGRWCFQRILVTESTEDWNRCWWSLCSPDILGGLCNSRHVVAAMLVLFLYTMLRNYLYTQDPFSSLVCLDERHWYIYIVNYTYI